MEEKVKISILLELYGKLLTQKQYEFMDYYYNDDLSLSEIADNEKITRQAVNKVLIQAKKKLEEYESKLKFMQKEEKIKGFIEDIEKTPLNETQKKTIGKIKQQMDF